MWIKILGPGAVKSDGYICEPEEYRQIPDEVARRWIQHGWAEDPDGKIPTGERRILNVGLDVQNAKVSQSATKPGR